MPISTSIPTDKIVTMALAGMSSCPVCLYPSGKATQRKTSATFNIGMSSNSDHRLLDPTLLNLSPDEMISNTNTSSGT